ncbi:MAG: hypothetical protein ACRDNF_22070 [Streptosporangiaceae bacterium]
MSAPEIEAAMGRLLDGVPLRSDGTLTIVSLAIEAGLKRHVLTRKHTDLRDRFYARVKAQDAVPASETALREQNAALRRTLEDLRAERDGLDLSREFPKPLTGDQIQAADIVITMGCGDACPVYPGKRYLDWDLPDPAGLDLAAVRPIRQRVRDLLHDLNPSAR